MTKRSGICGKAEGPGLGSKGFGEQGQIRGGALIRENGLFGKGLFGKGLKTTQGYSPSPPKHQKTPPPPPPPPNPTPPPKEPPPKKKRECPKGFLLLLFLGVPEEHRRERGPQGKGFLKHTGKSGGFFPAFPEGGRSGGGKCRS